MKIKISLSKIDLYSQLLIIPFFILTIISGFSKSYAFLFSADLGRYLHNTFELLLILFVIIHVAIQSKTALARHGIRGRKLDYLILIIAVLSFISALWMNSL